jgi:hypothetical protein
MHFGAAAQRRNGALPAPPIVYPSRIRVKTLHGQPKARPTHEYPVSQSGVTVVIERDSS